MSNNAQISIEKFREDFGLTADFPEKETMVTRVVKIGNGEEDRVVFDISDESDYFTIEMTRTRYDGSIKRENTVELTGRFDLDGRDIVFWPEGDDPELDPNDLYRELTDGVTC